MEEKKGNGNELKQEWTQAEILEVKADVAELNSEHHVRRHSQTSKLNLMSARLRPRSSTEYSGKI